MKKVLLLSIVFTMITSPFFIFQEQEKDKETSLMDVKFEIWETKETQMWKNGNESEELVIYLDEKISRYKLYEDKKHIPIEIEYNYEQ